MNPRHLFVFECSPDSIQLCAIFVAQLIREGVTFEVCKDKFSVEITLTGGF